MSSIRSTIGKISKDQIIQASLQASEEKDQDKSYITSENPRGSKKEKGRTRSVGGKKGIGRKSKQARAADAIEEIEDIDSVISSARKINEATKKDHSGDLDEIEEGFLRFLQNNEVDTEFQEIQRSLQDFNSDEEMDTGILSFDGDTEVGVDDESLEPSAIAKKKQSSSPAAAVSPYQRRKVGRKRKEDEEVFDIPAYLDKEFSQYRRSSRDLDEINDDAFYEEMLAEQKLKRQKNSSLPGSKSRPSGSLQEELSELEKVLLNFDEEEDNSQAITSGWIDPYSMKKVSTERKGKEKNSRKKPAIETKDTTNGDDDEDVFGAEGRDLEDVLRDHDYDMEEEEGIFDGEENLRIEEQMDDLMRLKTRMKDARMTDVLDSTAQSPSHAKLRAAPLSNKGGRVSKRLADTRSKRSSEDRAEGDGEEEEDELFSGRFGSRSRFPYNQELEDRHNITAEEIKEVLSSFDDDGVVEEEEGLEGDEDGSTKSENATTFGFDLDEFFASMNRTEDLERDLLNQRRERKEQELSKLQAKLSQIARITQKGSNANALEKKKAVRELQLELLGIQEELETINSRGMLDEFARGEEDDTELSETEDFETVSGREEDGGETDSSDSADIMSAEEYKRKMGTRTRKRNIRTYYRDLMTNEGRDEETLDRAASDPFQDILEEEEEEEEKEVDDKSSSLSVTESTMTEEELVKAGVNFDENAVRRPTLRLTQTMIVPTTRPGTNETINQTVTTPLYIDARYPDWKLDLRDYMANVNVTKIIQDGPDWSLLPRDNDTELLLYAEKIYERLSEEQDLFYDHSYAYIPESLRVQRNIRGEIISEEEADDRPAYPLEEHDIELMYTADDPMRSRLVITAFITYFSSREDLERSIQVVQSLFRHFREALQHDERVQYQLWIYTSDFFETPFVIPEPLFRKYDYDLTAYRRSQCWNIPEIVAQDRMERHERLLAEKIAKGELPDLSKTSTKSGGGRKKPRSNVEEESFASLIEKSTTDENLKAVYRRSLAEINAKYPLGERPRYYFDALDVSQTYFITHTPEEIEALKAEVLREKYGPEASPEEIEAAEELSRSSQQGILQMWCEGYNSYHLIDGKIMKDLWGGINPEVIFAPKNLEKLTKRIQWALTEDSLNAVSLTDRMYYDWKIGDILNPPTDMTELDYNLDESSHE